MLTALLGMQQRKVAPVQAPQNGCCLKSHHIGHKERKETHTVIHIHAYAFLVPKWCRKEAACVVVQHHNAACSNFHLEGDTVVADGSLPVTACK